MQNLISAAFASLLETLGLKISDYSSNEDIGSETTTYSSVDNKLLLCYTKFTYNTIASLVMEKTSQGMKRMLPIKSLNANYSRNNLDLGTDEYKWAQELSKAFPEVCDRLVMIMNCPDKSIGGRCVAIAIVTEENELIAIMHFDTDKDLSVEKWHELFRGTVIIETLKKHYENVSQ